MSHSTEFVKCLIVDDESLARREMRTLLSLHPKVTVCGEASTVSEALTLTETTRPDLVFLDIKLQGESGFDYVALMPTPSPAIVFVTAYDQFAIKGFECNAMDYLLKPIKPERLAESLRRIRHFQPSPSPKADPDQVIFIKGTTTSRFATWSAISHILADGNYSHLTFGDGSGLTVLRPLKDWLFLAPANTLFQIHRTALVQLQSIREILPSQSSSRREIITQTGHQLPVGRAYLNNLKTALQKLS